MNDTILTETRIHAFALDGYLVLSELVAEADLHRAEAEVNRLVSEDPPPQGHVGHHFYWQRSEQSPALFDVVQPDGKIWKAVAQLVGSAEIEVASDQVQVSLNIPPYVHRPGRPHIDRYQRDQDVPGTFTLLAGLLLTDQVGDNGGNLWVWPGTHRAHAAFFAARGPEAFAAAQGYPDIDLPEPTQVHGCRGDVLLAHYLLGHNIGGNFQSEQTRRALYWRLQARGHETRWADCLADVWCEYEGVPSVVTRA